MRRRRGPGSPLPAAPTGLLAPRCARLPSLVRPVFTFCKISQPWPLDGDHLLLQQPKKSSFCGAPAEPAVLGGA